MVCWPCVATRWQQDDGFWGLLRQPFGKRHRAQSCPIPSGEEGLWGERRMPKAVHAEHHGTANPSADEWNSEISRQRRFKRLQERTTHRYLFPVKSEGPPPAPTLCACIPFPNFWDFKIGTGAPLTNFLPEKFEQKLWRDWAGLTLRHPLARWRVPLVASRRTVSP